MFDKGKSVYSLTSFYLAMSCLGASFAFAAWDGSATVPEARDTVLQIEAGNNEIIDVTFPLYHISTPEQLAGLAKMINFVETPSEDPAKDPDADENAKEPTVKEPWRGCIVLDNDIVFGSDMSSVSEFPWEPIGNAEGFIGALLFDGKNHTIYGLNLASKKDSVFGLFGFVDNGFFKNVTIANYGASFGADSNAYVSSFYGAALVGFTSSSIIHNVHTRGGLIKFEALPRKMVDERVVGVNHVTIGNVVGRMDGLIDSCSNASDIEVHFDSDQTIGGVVGFITSPGTTVLVDSVSYCSNTGKIVSKSQSTNQSSEAGGIVGFAKAFVVHCSNSGSVSIDYGDAGGISGNGKHAYYCENTGSIYGGRNAGGIIGNGTGIVVRGTDISWCTNKGSVEGNYAGGIVGDGGAIYFSVNEGEVKGKCVGGIAGMNTSSIRQSINRGVLAGDSVGGICGRNKDLVISSYSYTSASATDLIGGIAAVNPGRIVTSAYDSTLLPSVEIVALQEKDGSVLESFALSTKEMQSAEFVDKLNEALRDEAKGRIMYEEGRYSRLDWSFDGGYPHFSDSSHLPLFRIDLDDSLFVSYGFTDYKGHLVDLPPAYSTKGRYFEGWVDSTGKTVSKSTVFNGPATIYAKYSKTIKDPSLVVYRPDPTVIGWNGELSIPKLRMHLDTSLYWAIFTPSELAWYLSKGANYTTRAALVNDIVMGKDSLSVMTRELKTLGEFGRYVKRVFDGNNHKIYGLNGSLFRDNYGQIKNLHLVNSLLKGGHGAFAQLNRGEILNSSLRRAVLENGENLRTVAGFVYQNYNASIIDSCVNYSDFDVPAGSYEEVAGFASLNDGIIRNSRNLGNIKANGSTRVAGIVASNSDKGSILNCINEGDIEYVGYRNMNLGGLVADNGWGMIKGSKNFGKITVRLLGSYDGISIDPRASLFSPSHVAGVVADDADLDSCENHGDITAIAMDDFKGGLIMGGVSAGTYVFKDVKLDHSLNTGAITFVDSTSLILKTIMLGGVAGRANVSSSRNEGDVKIVLADSSKNYGMVEDFMVGGVAADSRNTFDCVNKGNVFGLGVVGGVVANSQDSIARVVNYGRIEVLGVNHKDGSTGGICGSCHNIEKSINLGSVTMKKSKDDTYYNTVGGLAGYASGRLKMVANVAPVTVLGESEKVIGGGLVALLSTEEFRDAYNWGAVTTDGEAGGLYGHINEFFPERSGIPYSSDLNEFIRNVYNAAPVNASKANPVGVSPKCPDEVYPDFTALVYYDSSYSREKSCEQIQTFLEDETLQNFYVYTSPLSTKYMQSDDFVDLLNTSGNTAENSHVWKKSETYPVFDEETLGMSFSYEPLSSSSVASSSSVVKSSSSVKIESSSSSSSKPASSSSVVESSSSSKAKSSSSSVKSSSSGKAKSSSSSVKSSSSSKAKSSSSVKRSSSSATSLKTLVQRSFRVHVQGRMIVLSAARGKRVQVFDALGHLVASKHVDASGNANIALEKAGTYIVRVDGLVQSVILK